MPLTLDFPGKAEHPGYLALEDVSRVTVTLTSDDGSPVRDPWLVQAWYVTGKERTVVEPKGSSGATAHYQLMPRPGAPPLAWFEVEATERASDRVLKARLCVLSPLGEGLRTGAWWALGIAALYTVVVLPEAPRLVSKVQAVPSFLGLGGGAVVVGFGVSYLKKLPRVDPRKLLIAGALAVAWMLFIWSSVTFVINDSLDPISVEGATLEPGEYTFVRSLGDIEGYCEVKDDETACVPFPHHASAWHTLAHGLTLRERRLGCPGLGIPTEYKAHWTRAGKCRPEDGLVLHHVDPSPFGGTGWGKGTQANIHLRWADGDHKALRLPDPEHLQPIQFVAADATALADMQLVMTDTGPIEELSIAVVLGQPLYSPRQNTAARLALDADIRVKGMSAGHLFGAFSAAPRCFPVTPGDRLSTLVVHGGGSMSELRVVAPLVATTLPMCWDQKERPAAGELQLDAHWAPSPAWRLDVPAELMPRELAVHDADARYWGTLRCGGKDSTAKTWHVAAIHMDQPRDDLGDLYAEPSHKEGKPPLWQRARGRAEDGFAWTCWKDGDKPTRYLYGPARGWLEAATETPELDGEYRSGVSEPTCSVCWDGTPATCTATHTPEMEAWFRHAGPRGCNARTSVRCGC